MREVKVSQELLPCLAARFGCPNCEFSGKSVGKELPPSVLHDKRAGEPALTTTHLLSVQGDRPGSGSGQPTQHTHQSRLTNAIHARDASNFSCVEVSIKTTKNGGFSIGEAQVPARQARFLTRSGDSRFPPRGHPGLGQSRVHQGTQAEGLPLAIAHRIKLVPAPTMRNRALLHEKNLVGQPSQKMKAVLDNDDSHTLFFEDLKCMSHVRDGVGV